uniref:CSON003242 protein n=1 Tax=Culicoides sonorensis TaxID=179676 RepID=A0A336LSM6_CULSO
MCVFEDACLRCQAESKKDALGRQDCVVVWGECNHSFHHCCMSLYVNQLFARGLMFAGPLIEDTVLRCYS